VSFALIPMLIKWDTSVHLSDLLLQLAFWVKFLCWDVKGIYSAQAKKFDRSSWCTSLLPGSRRLDVEVEE
jgi:hypothetical protein